MTSWQGATLESIANELKNIREILEKQSTTEQSSMGGEWQITDAYQLNNRKCEVNVHTTNIVEKQEPFKTYAPGGVIRPKPDYELEADTLNRLISKLPPSDREKELLVLARIKNRCKCRNECEGCWYHRAEEELNINACMLSGGIPEEWLI